MVSATGDWTKNTMEQEYPAVRSLYSLLGAADRVHALRIDAEHNYNQKSREAMYAWMARWLQHAPADVARPERGFTPTPLADALVFHQRPLPPNAVTAEQLTENWIASAQRQLATMPLDVRARALLHALGMEDAGDTTRTGAAARTTAVLLASPDAELERLLKQAGLAVTPVSSPRFDADAAARVRHFETYNRTAASQRVADIVAASRAHPGAVLVASGDAALAGLLAAAVAPVSFAVLDVGPFDPSRDADFLERLYIPGLRRAGGIETAARLAKGQIVVHNAKLFTLAEPDASPGPEPSRTRVQAEKLSARQIVTLVRTATRRQPRS
jgi:hypothetical protein